MPRRTQSRRREQWHGTARTQRRRAGRHCHWSTTQTARLSTQNVSPTSRNSRSDCLVTHDACDPVAPQAQASPQRFQRVIRNAVGLRFLNIPNGMFRHLNLADMYSKGPHIGRRQNVCTVTLVIPSQGISHVVKMVRTTSNGQQHRRLSTGWRELCKRAKVSLGDKLTFTRDWHSKQLIDVTAGEKAKKKMKNIIQFIILLLCPPKLRVKGTLSCAACHF